jgi:uncharacterized YccA/Bax inhibitor family protein
MRSGNPALNDNTFLDVGRGTVVGGDTMTLAGTVNKTGFMLLILVATAAYTWSLYSPENPGAMMPWLLAGGIGGFVVALVTIFKKTWSPVTPRRSMPRSRDCSSVPCRRCSRRASPAS